MSDPDGDCQPTVVEYTSTIQAWANYVPRHLDHSRDAVTRVESLLDEMLNSNDEKLRPNTLTYAAILKVIAAAKRIPSRGDRAESILSIMDSEQVDITPYIMSLFSKCNARETKEDSS